MALELKLNQTNDLNQTSLIPFATKQLVKITYWTFLSANKKWWFCSMWTMDFTSLKNFWQRQFGVMSQMRCVAWTSAALWKKRSSNLSTLKPTTLMWQETSPHLALSGNHGHDVDARPCLQNMFPRMISWLTLENGWARASRVLMMHVLRMFTENFLMHDKKI